MDIKHAGLEKVVYKLLFKHDCFAMLDFKGVFFIHKYGKYRSFGCGS